MFDPTSTKYSADRDALQELWGDTEWAAARRTVLNAHYTHTEYVSAMWNAADRLGVPSDAHVLEPGCGTGNFIAQARPGQQVTGVELDPTTADVARLLHPAANIRNESFGDTFLDHDGYDLAIGNVPFAQTRLYDPAYNEARLSLHNHFIVKSLRQTKPGGIVMVMSSRWTMDAKSERSRREIAKHGELLGAVRMPRGAHGEIAGTDATIDVLVLRRHLGEPPATDPAWLQTVDVDGSAGAAAINSYFEDHLALVSTIRDRVEATDVDSARQTIALEWLKRWNQDQSDYQAPELPAVPATWPNHPAVVIAQQDRAALAPPHRNPWDGTWPHAQGGQEPGGPAHGPSIGF
ncbi:hypothetical protein ACFWHR_12195 [Leucobacter sp. NPDC058333]|uniref:hypothetical protein n=1 Tax=Leucobacter sp. NPDC058333 TaxID=3346450 RepID=UPI003663AE09